MDQRKILRTWRMKGDFYELFSDIRAAFLAHSQAPKGFFGHGNPYRMDLNLKLYGKGEVLKIHIGAWA